MPNDDHSASSATTSGVKVWFWTFVRTGRRTFAEPDPTDLWMISNWFLTSGYTLPSSFNQGDVSPRYGWVVHRHISDLLVWFLLSLSFLWFLFSSYEILESRKIRSKRLVINFNEQVIQFNTRPPSIVIVVWLNGRVSTNVFGVPEPCNEVSCWRYKIRDGASDIFRLASLCIRYPKRLCGKSLIDMPMYFQGRAWLTYLAAAHGSPPKSLSYLDTVVCVCTVPRA